MTVLELVVVCAVTALLMAVLIPTIWRARPDAHHAWCMTNLKQIGLGIAQYYDDYSNQMPRMVSISGLARDIAPYISGQPRVFVCPQDKSRKPANHITNVTQSNYAFVTNVAWQSPVMEPLAFDQLQPAGITVLTGRNTWSPTKSAHKEGGNVLWTDGHVDWNTVFNVGTNRYPVIND